MNKSLYLTLFFEMYVASSALSPIQASVTCMRVSRVAGRSDAFLSVRSFAFAFTSHTCLLCTGMSFGPYVCTLNLSAGPAKISGRTYTLINTYCEKEEALSI
jgi:hypothetical protein